MKTELYRREKLEQEKKFVKISKDKSIAKSKKNIISNKKQSITEKN